MSRDEAAESWLISCDLANVTSPAQLQTFLQAVTVARDRLVAAPAACTTAFGLPLLQRLGNPQLIPIGLTMPPSLGSVAVDSHDILFYVFARSDADVAEFLRELDATRPLLTGVQIERGYQRRDKRETFGQRDGVRNIAPADRAHVAFVGDDQDEPSWAEGGSYLAYLKIRQNVDAWKQLDPATQATVIGRRPDGSRLDLPTGTTVEAEGPFADPLTPAPASHVRKTGPRGPNDDSVHIFRRGTPYIEATAAGTIEQGLQFVSYQASLDDFDTILNRWMLNQTFPDATAGVDQLFNPALQLTTILKGAFYFAVPHDSRFLGAGLFDADSRGTTKVIIKLTVIDPSTGVADPAASLEGASFEITDPATGIVLGSSLITNGAGRAMSAPLPENTPLTITQQLAPAGSQIASPPSQTVTLTCRPLHVPFQNAHIAPAGQYGA